MSSKQNNLVILRFLGFDNVADIEELVVPGVQRVNEKSWSSIRSGTTPARDRRDFFLTQRHERDDAEVDRVAAGLLVIRDELCAAPRPRSEQSPGQTMPLPSWPRRWRYRGAPALPPRQGSQNHATPTAG